MFCQSERCEREDWPSSSEERTVLDRQCTGGQFSNQWEQGIFATAQFAPIKKVRGTVSWLLSSVSFVGCTNQNATDSLARFLPRRWTQNYLNWPITGLLVHRRWQPFLWRRQSLVIESLALQFSMPSRCPGNIPAKSVKNLSRVNIKEIKQNSLSSFIQHGQVQASLFYLKASTVCPVPLVNKTSMELWK